MKYLLSHCDYIIRNNEPILVLKAVDENGDSKLFKKRGFKPYFYIPATEYNGVEDKKIRKTIYGKDVVKKEVQTPPEVNNIRDNYSKTWESDIRFPIRYMIDSGIKSGFVLDDQNNIKPEQVSVNDIMPTKLFFDIETSVSGDSVNFDPDKTDDRIVSIVCRYINENKSIDKEKVISDEDESIILDEFIQFVEDTDPEFLLAWNIYFDIGNIYNRCKKHDVDISRLSPVGEVYKRGSGNNKEVVCKGRIVDDLMHSYDKFYTNRTLDSKALEDVCYDELGIEHSEFDYSKMESDKWKDNIKEIIKYNKLDVERMVKLDKELKIVRHFENLRRVTGCSFEQAHRTSGFVDVLFLRKYNEKYVLPSTKYSKAKDFKGGFVELFVEPGIYNWVLYLDFSAHYPTLIDAYNMSAETLTDKNDENTYEVDIPDGKVYFKKKPKGVMPIVFDEMQSERYKLKDKRDSYDKSEKMWDYYHSRQYTLKQLINSIWGYHAFSGSRLYRHKLASSITAVGRQFILDTIDFVESRYDAKTIYSDSDSVLVSVKAKDKYDAVEKSEQISEDVNKYWNEKTEENDWYKSPVIECEKIYKKLLYGKKKTGSGGAKKRYAGRKIFEEGQFTDELGITGFEVVRSDQSKPTKEIQKKFFEILLSDSENKIMELKKVLENTIEKMKNPDCVEDIAKLKSIRKNPDDYEVPYTVHGIKHSNEQLGKSFGITESKAYIIHLDKCPDFIDSKIEYGNDDNKVRRDVKRIALDKDDDIQKWVDYIDFDKHIKKQVEDKVDKILDSAGLTYSEVKNGQKQMDLGSFG